MIRQLLQIKLWWLPDFLFFVEIMHFLNQGVFNGQHLSTIRIRARKEQIMVILCILIFPFAVLAELMKMNNNGGRRKG